MSLMYGDFSYISSLTAQNKIIRRYEGWYYTKLVSYIIIFYLETDCSRIRPLPSTTLMTHTLISLQQSLKHIFMFYCPFLLIEDNHIQNCDNHIHEHNYDHNRYTVGCSRATLVYAFHQIPLPSARHRQKDMVIIL